MSQAEGSGVASLSAVCVVSGCVLKGRSKCGGRQSPPETVDRLPLRPEEFIISIQENTEKGGRKRQDVFSSELPVTLIKRAQIGSCHSCGIACTGWHQKRGFIVQEINPQSASGHF